MDSFKKELQGLLIKHNISFCLRVVKLGHTPHAKLSIIKKEDEADVWITPSVKYLEEKHFVE